MYLLNGCTSGVMQVHDSRQPSVKYVKSVLQWKQIMMTFMTSNISFFIHQDKNWLKFCVLCLSSSGTKHYRKWSRDELTQLANSSRPHIPKNVPLPPHHALPLHLSAWDRLLLPYYSENATAFWGLWFFSTHRGRFGRIWKNRHAQYDWLCSGGGTNRYAHYTPSTNL